jgi:hypothetical protein
MSGFVYEGSVFSAMRDKDPELFAQLQGLSAPAAMYRWLEVYPEDFPKREMTSVADVSAVKPKPAVH